MHPEEPEVAPLPRFGTILVAGFLVRKITRRRRVQRTSERKKRKKKRKEKEGEELAVAAITSPSKPRSPPPSPRPTRENKALAAQRRPALYLLLVAARSGALLPRRRTVPPVRRGARAATSLVRCVRWCTSPSSGASNVHPHRAMRIVFSVSLDRLPQSAAARGVTRPTHRGGADLQFY